MSVILAGQAQARLEQIKKERDDQVAQAAEQTEMKMLVSERVSFLQRSLAASRAIAPATASGLRLSRTGSPEMVLTPGCVRA